MKQIAEGFQVTQLRTIATCACRSRQRRRVLPPGQRRAGARCRYHQHRQEALLAFFSVQRAFDLTDKPVAVVDIGGGSTEIVLALGGLVEASAASPPQSISPGVVSTLRSWKRTRILAVAATASAGKAINLTRVPRCLSCLCCMRLNFAAWEPPCGNGSICNASTQPIIWSLIMAASWRSPPI